MKAKFKHEINFLAIVLAIGSFCIGTLLLLLYVILHNSVIGIGFYFTFIAAIINSLMLIILILNAIVHYKDYIENVLTILALLVNIPTTIFYMDIVI